MTTTKNLGLTLHGSEVGQAILDIVDANLAIIESDMGVIEEYPSGLVAGTAPGRLVALAQDGRVYLAFDSPPAGQEYRMQILGITMDISPTVGLPTRLLMFGVARFDSSDSLWSLSDPSVPTVPGAPGDVVVPLDPVYGKVAYLLSGDLATEHSQGFVTSSTDVGDSENKIVAGLFLPNGFLLFMPVAYAP